MHGGTNQGAPKGNRNAWKHGDRTAEAENQLKTVRQITRTLRAAAKLRQGTSVRSSEVQRLFDAMNEPDEV